MIRVESLKIAEVYFSVKVACFTATATMEGSVEHSSLRQQQGQEVTVFFS